MRLVGQEEVGWPGGRWLARRTLVGQEDVGKPIGSSPLQPVGPSAPSSRTKRLNHDIVYLMNPSDRRFSLPLIFQGILAAQIGAKGEIPETNIGCGVGC